mgnify:CR=1 FL=1
MDNSILFRGAESSIFIVSFSYIEVKHYSYLNCCLLSLFLSLVISKLSLSFFATEKPAEQSSAGILRLDTNISRRYYIYFFPVSSSCPLCVQEAALNSAIKSYFTIRPGMSKLLPELLMKNFLHLCIISDYSTIVATLPEPTVLPPSRIAKRRPCSIATGWISSIVISTLSPGMHISVPSGSSQTPVTSVVLK